MLKHIFTYALFNMLFSAVSPVYAETADTIDHAQHHEQNNLDWPGIYHGFLPCDDCNGVKTTLGLNKNNTYILITQYIGKSEREIVEKGKFTAGNAANTLELTPRNNSITRYYFVDKDILIQLDGSGNRIAGKLADRYVLRRTDLKESTTSHAH